jgi:plasmid segregation protein ParM
MYQQIIGADIGRCEVKLCSSGEYVRFPARVGEWQQREISSGGDYEVEIDGEKWFVGELALLESHFGRRMVEQNKANQELLIELLAGLYLIMEPDADILLVTALPIDQYSAANREALRKLLRGRYSVSVNHGQTKEIVLDRIDITWEGAGIYFDFVTDDFGAGEYLWLAERNVHICDIGSRTCNLLTVSGGKYVSRLSLTDNSHGTLLLENSARGAKRISESNKEQFARAIKALVSSNWLDADYGSGCDHDSDSDVLIFAGGGAKLIEQYLREYYPSALFPVDPVLCQVSGLYKMGMARNGG